jgi:hypothetical protein
MGLVSAMSSLEARSNFQDRLCLSMELESAKKLEILSGCSTRRSQTLPWSSAYFISYSFPGLIDPALVVATNKELFLLNISILMK